ncbi:MAG TPA: MFS transporter [Beijerinckiaceae bacterium]|nr:MFS transporter [Beijerinckiaceae bacterium]
MARSAFLVFGGIIAAAQVGKIIVAMPLIQAELQIGLGQVSLLIAVFATLGSLFGIVAGVAGRRLGAHRCLVGGMMTMALASAAGASAPTIGWLLMSRIVEGIGFLAAAVVIPDLLSRAVVEKDRDLVFGLWSAYMPLGGAAMLLVGPWMPAFGWRHLWLACALVTALYALVAALLPKDAAEKAPAEDVRSFLRDSLSVVRDRTFLWLAAGFGLYTAQYFVIAGFLPVLLVSTLHLDLGRASLITTVAVLANACGNMSAGLLLRSGVPLWANILVAFGGFAVAAPFVFSIGLPPIMVAGVATVTLGLGGLVPGSVFAAIPVFAAKRGLVIPAVGLVQQASNIGQFGGPFVTGLVAEHFGWPAAPAILLPSALVGVAIAVAIRKTMYRLKLRRSE